MKIRYASRRDYKRLTELYNSDEALMGINTKASTYSKENIIEYIFRSGHNSFFVCVDNRKIVGAVLVELH